MDRLKQDGQAEQYFLHMDQLIQKAGRTTDAQLIVILEKNLSEGLINKIFSAEEVPMTYQEWRQWAINYDNVWHRRWELGKRSTEAHQLAPHTQVTESDDMDFDSTKTRHWTENVTCFACGKKGHFAWDCKTKGPTSTQWIEEGSRDGKQGFQKGHALIVDMCSNVPIGSASPLGNAIANLGVSDETSKLVNQTPRLQLLYPPHWQHLQWKGWCTVKAWLPRWPRTEEEYYNAAWEAVHSGFVLNQQRGW
jgi:hypothetical protein